MNLNPDLSSAAAIGMALFAASLWGSWAVSLKYLRGYPIDAFMMTLLSTSLVFVWGVALVLDRGALFTNLRDSLLNDPWRVPVTLVCGILYMIGMRLSLYVMNTIGLTLSQPISSSINIFIGTLLSGFIGGMPENLSLGRVLLACVCLFGAVMMSLWAGRIRIDAQVKAGVVPGQSGMTTNRADLIRAVGLVLISGLFTPAYSFGLAFGLRSTTHPEGLAVLPFMTMLATGAFLGGLLTCGVTLTRRRQWHLIWEAPLSLHRWGIMSGLFHYGGNIIHTFATAQLSAVVSWPLGLTGGLWSQFWGLTHGEFQKAPAKAYVVLAAAIVLYISGAYLIASTRF